VKVRRFNLEKSTHFISTVFQICVSPNKAPEPTPTSVTPRATSRGFEVKRRSVEPILARGAPDAVVAHL